MNRLRVINGLLADDIISVIHSSNYEVPVGHPMLCKIDSGGGIYRFTRELQIVYEDQCNLLVFRYFMPKDSNYEVIDVSLKKHKRISYLHKWTSVAVNEADSDHLRVMYESIRALYKKVNVSDTNLCQYDHTSLEYSFLIRLCFFKESY